MEDTEDNFEKWLMDHGATAYPKLSELAKAQGWPQVTSLVQAWHLIDSTDGLTSDLKATLKDSASLAYVEFERSRVGSAKRRSFSLTPFGIGVFCFMGLTLLILAGAIFEDSPIWGNGGKPLLERLADIEEARGLITFVFTVGVIALALIIVTSSVTSKKGDGVELERAREILMTLVAIMGTILGFYFGKADDPPDPVDAEVVEPAEEPPNAAPEGVSDDVGQTPATEGE